MANIVKGSFVIEVTQSGDTPLPDVIGAQGNIKTALNSITGTPYEVNVDSGVKFNGTNKLNIVVGIVCAQTLPTMVSQVVAAIEALTGAVYKVVTTTAYVTKNTI